MNLEKFPVCLFEIYHQQNNVDQSQNRLFQTDFTKTTVWYWLELGLNITNFGLLSSIYIVGYPFYSVWMNDKYGVNSFISLSIISLACIILAFVSQLINESFIKYSLLGKYYFCAIIHILLIIVCILLAYTDKYSYLLWIYQIILVCCDGIALITSEILVIEFQPKMDAGKINGIKTILRYVIAATMASLMSILWYRGKNYVWYPGLQGIYMVVCLILDVILIIANTKF